MGMERGEVMEYSGDQCNSRFKMDYNTHKWSDFILMPRVREMGMQGKRIKGKHRVREKITVWNNYYMEKQWSWFC